MGFFLKQGFCFLPKKKICARPGNILNTRVRPVGSGAHDAQKIGLVERRFWSKGNKKAEATIQNQQKKLAHLVRLIVSRRMDPPLGVFPTNVPLKSSGQE